MNNILVTIGELSGVTLPIDELVYRGSMVGWLLGWLVGWLLGWLLGRVVGQVVG